MGCSTSTLVEVQPQLHVTQEVWAESSRMAGLVKPLACNGCCLQMIVALLEAPGNMTWSQPATWAGAAIGMSKQVQHC